MVITKLSIENYKVFEGEHQVIFPDQNKPVVFVGVNGAGKTAIIQAIIGCLWGFYLKIQERRGYLSGIFSQKNINIKAEREANVQLEWKGQEKYSLSTGFKITPNRKTDFLGQKKVREYIAYLKRDISAYPESELRLPIVVYYPVERTIFEPTFKMSNFGDRFDAFKDAFNQSVDFNQFFEWFRSTEDLENEIRLNKDNSYVDKGLDAVRKAVLIFLEDFTKIRVRRTKRTTMVLEKSGNEYEVNQLSHGEKALIAMVGDLARRLVIANPGSKKPLNEEGIVLIDELDLHLHPTWQRTILTKLTKTFPNIQFICTTHSSLVLNHLAKESIFLLEDGKISALTDRFNDFNSYGADVEDILKIVQGTSSLIPEDIAKQFEEMYKLLDEGKIDEAKEMILELKKRTDPNQPELKRAETQIKFKELMGK